MQVLHGMHDLPGRLRLQGRGLLYPRQSGAFHAARRLSAAGNGGGRGRREALLRVLQPSWPFRTLEGTGGGYDLKVKINTDLREMSNGLGTGILLAARYVINILANTSASNSSWNHLIVMNCFALSAPTRNTPA